MLTFDHRVITNQSCASFRARIDVRTYVLYIAMQLCDAAMMMMIVLINKRLGYAVAVNEYAVPVHSGSLCEGISVQHQSWSVSQSIN